MSYLVVLIVDDPDHCEEILEGWESAGVVGVTIVESSGLGRLRRHSLREDVSIMPSIRDLFAMDEVHHRTLFSVVEEKEKVDRMVAIAQQVIGDLEQAHTGFLFVVPVLEVHGLGKHRGDRSKE
jgi:nitrogen regulatory protein PII